MKIPEERINRATGAVLTGLMGEAGLNQRTLAAAAGMSSVTVQKVLSGEQSIKIAQFINLVEGARSTPEEAIRRIEAKLAVSDPAAMVTPIRSKTIEEMPPAEREQERNAANRDAELESPEPEQP